MKKVYVWTMGVMVACSLSKIQGQEHEQLRAVFSVEDFSPENVFEEPIILEMPTDIDMTVGRERKPEISFRDIPFYCRFACTYVYEEKIQKWYYQLFGYLARWKSRSFGLARHGWGK